MKPALSPQVLATAFANEHAALQRALQVGANEVAQNVWADVATTPLLAWERHPPVMRYALSGPSSTTSEHPVAQPDAKPAAAASSFFSGFVGPAAVDATRELWCERTIQVEERLQALVGAKQKPALLIADFGTHLQAALEKMLKGSCFRCVVTPRVGEVEARGRRLLAKDDGGSASGDPKQKLPELACKVHVMFMITV